MRTMSTRHRYHVRSDYLRRHGSPQWAVVRTDDAARLLCVLAGEISVYPAIVPPAGQTP